MRDIQLDCGGMSLQEFGYKEQLSRVLTTKDLIIYGMIFMVPIAPFGVFGFVWNEAKGMVPLAYLVGLIGMFFTALSYAAMSRAFPLAGSVYTYAQRGLHEIAGFFSGWLILLDYMLVPSLLYLISAVALRPILPGVPGWIWLAAFISFNATVNLLGIEFTARVNRYMLVMELATLGLFVVLGLIALYGGAGAGSAHAQTDLRSSGVFLVDRGRSDIDCGAVVLGLRRHFDPLGREPGTPERGRPSDRAVVADGRRVIHAANLDRHGFGARNAVQPPRRRRSTKWRSAPAARGSGSSRFWQP